MFFFENEVSKLRFHGRYKHFCEEIVFEIQTFVKPYPMFVAK